MLKLNSELRAQAREALRGKWPMAAVAALIYSAIAGGLSAIPVIVNPEKPDVPLNKNDAFQKVQKRRVQEKR